MPTLFPCKLLQVEIKLIVLVITLQNITNSRVWLSVEKTDLGACYVPARHYDSPHTHTYPSVVFLETWWILYLSLEYLFSLSLFFIFPSQRQKKRREGNPRHRGWKHNNKTRAVIGRPTHQSQSSHQWHLLGNWGCRSASPAELLCSSCSSPTEPLQNRQRTKPPETSGKRERHEGRKQKETEKMIVFDYAQKHKITNEQMQHFNLIIIFINLPDCVIFSHVLSSENRQKRATCVASIRLLQSMNFPH